MIPYQNHHCHRDFTNPRISDCAVRISDYVDRAAQLGHTILSTVEHGWQGNYYEGWKAARKAGLKPLIGAEAYWVKDRTEKDNTNAHICLLAKNEKGRRALNNILSEANLTGFYSRPRVDIPLLLSLPKDDIWVTTACVAYWQYEDIDDITVQLANHFGKNFFLEVQYHLTEKQQLLNQHILDLHKKHNIPLIMGCDSHYILENDAQIRTDFLFSKGLEYPDEQGWFMDYPDGDTAYKRFADQGVLNHNQIMEAMENTNVLLEVEEYDSYIFGSDIKMPSMYPNLTQEEKDAEYRRLVYAGWEAYKPSVDPALIPTYEEEIRKEVEVVEQTKMADYFILDHHIIKRGIENGGVLTTTGRGSGVSWITNKLLGFTEVDRVAASVKMYPDRFMSAARILESGTLPDIDFNVADQAPFAKAQKEILGDDHAYPMLAYGTMKVSKAWKLYAKSQGVPFEVANAVSDQIKKYENALKHADEDEKHDIDPLDYIEPQYHQIYLDSAAYRGLIDSWSIAPCSYLLYSGSIREEIGLVRIKDNICAALDGHWAEESHFLKNDLLTVKTVDLTDRIYKRIGIKKHTVPELLAACTPDDPCWTMYQKGATCCLNQVERTGTSARVAKYRPTNISELCAFIAAIRPGFKSMYKTFEERKPFSYGVKAFDDLIQTSEMPYSFVLYQEMEMAAMNYAGIPMDECYTAIKNIAKKRVEKVLAYKETFTSGFREAILREGKSAEEADELAHKLWQIVEDSASYSFNASHSYCVALDSLYGAWLKSHHPLEFYEVALSVYDEKGDKDKMSALKEEAEKYFKIQFPAFKFRQDNRSIKADPATNSITNKLSAIKGFGSAMCRVLYDCGQEVGDSFFEVLQYLDKKSLKAAKVEPLIKIGYFSEFGNTTELLRMLAMWDWLKQGTAKKIAKDKLSGVMLELVQEFGTDKNPKGEELKQYTITDMPGLLRRIEQYILTELKLPEVDYRVMAQNQLEILGYVDMTTGKREDRMKLYIMELFAIENRWSKKGGIWKYKLKVKSLGSGNVASLDLDPKLMKFKPVQQGDIIHCLQNPYKDDKGYWHLVDYEVI